MNLIYHFDDFLDRLRDAGMSMGGENGEGIFTLCDFFGDSIKWHTEEKETDPWEWRMRVLNECSDIAYGKFFFKKSGYITREWYPYFYKVRRNGKKFNEAYQDGEISRTCKRIYDLLAEYHTLPFHLIKEYGGFTKENKSQFDRAMTELQMKFYITMCGKAAKISKAGEEYGWASTVFCMSESFFDQDWLTAEQKVSYEEAYHKIEERILSLNPGAKPLKINKFILG